MVRIHILHPPDLNLRALCGLNELGSQGGNFSELLEGFSEVFCQKVSSSGKVSGGERAGF